MANMFMVLFLLTGVLLILLVLIQKGRGGGLAGAFGGPGGHSAFGTKTADVLTKLTAGLGALFFLLSIVTALIMGRGVGGAEEGPPAPEPEQSAPAVPGPEAGDGGAEAGAEAPDETPAEPPFDLPGEPPDPDDETDDADAD